MYMYTAHYPTPLPHHHYITIASPSPLHHHYLTWIGPGLQQLVQEGYEEVEEVWAAEDVDEVLLVQLKEFPDEDVELLSEVDLLHRVREVGL